MKNGILLLIGLFTVSTSLFCQLSPGDIMITGINTDTPDDFTFIALANIPAGTEIHFTDNGVLSSGALRGGEGTTTYTVPTGGLAPGVVVSQLGNASDFVTPLSGLSSGGDQVIAYTGTEMSPTYIAAAQTNSTLWQVGSNDSNQSDLPTGLVDGLTAIAIGAGTGSESEIDNSEYTGTRDLAGRTKAEMLAILADPTNWTGSNSSLNLNTNNFAGVLPIQLLSFTATVKENQTLLNWTTTNELNNKFMAVERSENGRDFTEIGRVNGAGTTTIAQNYSFTDTKPVTGVNYYRLRQVDFDGHTEYHKVISAVVYGKEGNIRIAPTEVADEVMVYLPEVTESSSDILIYDMNGRLWKTVVLDAGNNTASFNLSQLAAGHYLLQLVNNEKVSTVRFNKL